ncbi:oligoribonuclease [Candidatus Saccharibacteria bacterium]|nr:oligoribonuclease [Candidatus Saccharibacteria bacterium]MCL1963129.1 oligoribonuclease [Candidatus Saccharibacteria bacterium]
MKQANLLWIDLEMTGLDPNEDRIMEVGVIATDLDLKEVARYSGVVKVPHKLAEARMVGGFWDKNALARAALLEQNLTEGKSGRTIEKELIKFLDDNFDNSQPIYLAGNSIHQDQKFIEREWPQFNARLHYRQLDVSAWKIIFEHLGIKFSKPEKHRAMADIEGSIAELKSYLKKVKK